MSRSARRPRSDRSQPLLVGFDRTLFTLACLATFAILILQLGEIGARAFGGSIVFATDVTGFLMVAAVFLALPDVTRRNEHITADFVVLLVGPRARHVIERVISPAVSAVYVLALIAILWALTEDSYLDGVRSEGITRMPLAGPQAMMVVALACMLLRLVLTLCGRSGTGDAGEPGPC